MRRYVYSVAVTIALVAVVAFFMFNSKSCSRLATDIRSDLGGGLERVVNVYTANGDLLAHYEGKIDIEEKDGGYIKFDFEGKRYIYYNCFIETIAEI